jgi:hypothetical protein
VGAIGGTCDHCDSIEIAALADKLLDALCQASLNEYPGLDPPPDPSINRLKDLLMEMIGLGSISRLPPHTSLSLRDVVHKLDRFSSFVLESKSLWSKAASMFTPEYSPQFFPQRRELLRGGVFTDPERDLIACALIRKYDLDHRYHCAVKGCGQECVYSIHACPHPGCSVRFSLKYQREHEDVCVFRVVTCPRECGESLPRQGMAVSPLETLLLYLP